MSLFRKRPPPPVANTTFTRFAKQFTVLCGPYQTPLKIMAYDRADAVRRAGADFGAEEPFTIQAEETRNAENMD